MHAFKMQVGGSCLLLAHMTNTITSNTSSETETDYDGYYRVSPGSLVSSLPLIEKSSPCFRWSTQTVFNYVNLFSVDIKLQTRLQSESWIDLGRTSRLQE